MKDVEEFIKQLKKRFDIRGNTEISNYHKGIHEIIDKLAGKELREKK